ncbi:MAG: phenylalanine--tRNA ligase subunit beta [Nitrospirae bacterium]|nr:phenylalanine--tRNA ligase subunit beta [Nitrospirota bacterium]
MKASINWLKEFVDFSAKPIEIANALTMAGLEVEGVEEVDGDTILEVNITPNRADCLSIIGVAREIAASLSLPFKKSKIPVIKEEFGAPEIEIKAPELCRRYASRIIRGVKIAPSPEWLSKRLEAHAIRSINNVVDATNYVLLEMGQPLHAFDLNNLTGHGIVVDKAGSIDKFFTLDNEERALETDTLMIWDKEKPVAVAGVMGGLNTEVTLSTSDILLESAYFNPPSVRRASKALNLSTESSYRFERGVDINAVVTALERAVDLILQTAGGKAGKLTDIHPKPLALRQISVGLSKINKIIGVSLKDSEVQDILTRLGFDNKKTGDTFVVIPPSFREDIQQDIDIIEEIARLYGYDKIPVTFPKVRLTPVKVNTHRNLIKITKDFLRRSGYSEVINYSFLNPSVFDKLRLSPDDKRRNTIKIKNPLRKEENSVRTTLIPALLGNIGLNINHGEKSLRFFELSKVFLPSKEKLPEEPLHLGAVCLKDSRMPSSIWEGKHECFYDLKGALENLMAELKVKDYSFVDTDSCEPYLHPGKSCTIKVNNEVIGSLGVLHPAAAEALELTGDIALFELNLSSLFLHILPKITYKSLPKYPYVERDISIVVSKDINAADIENAIARIDSNLIEGITLFDIYTGSPIPKDKKSLAFSIRFRAEDRTLTDAEVDVLHSKMVSLLESSFKAELRS